MLFEHAMLQDYAHLFPVAGTESLEYRTFECILVLRSGFELFYNAILDLHAFIYFQQSTKCRVLISMLCYLVSGVPSFL